MSVYRLAITFVAFLCMATVASAQLDTATLLGTVTDASGAVVPGAEVEVQNMGTRVSVRATTDRDGAFVVPALPVGTYRVSVTASGFATSVREGIALSVASRVRVPIQLSAGIVTETVTVTGERPPVDTESATLGGIVSSQQVSSLPLQGRALTQLLATIPGVSMQGTGVSRMAMSGAAMGRLFEPTGKFLLDGTDSGQVDSDVPDGGYGTAARMTRASIESISEVRVLSNSFSAEYGQAGGSVINFVTRSGTNQLHGTVFHYFRNEVLDSRDYFNREPARKPAFRLNQFGSSIGGPIARDRAFFFANYEGARQRRGIIQNVFVPTQAFRDGLDPVLRAPMDQLPLPNAEAHPTNVNLARFIRGVSNELREDTFAGRVDHQVTEADRLSFRYNFNDSFTKTFFGVAQGQARVIPYRAQMGRINYTRTISPTLLNEATIGFNRLGTKTAAASEEAIRTSPRVVFGGGVPAVGPTVFDLIVGNTNYTVVNNISWVRGRHQLKFGGLIVRNQVNKQQFFQQIVTFLGIGAAATQYQSGQPFSVATIGLPMAGQRNTQTGFYVQDDIRVSSNFTLNLGLRYSFDTAPSESQGRNRNFDLRTGILDPLGTQSFIAPKTNFGPRIGFAWNPIAGHSFVLRGGYGIFHAGIQPAMAQNLPANEPTFGMYRSITILDDPTLTAFPIPDLSNLASTLTLSVIPKNYKAPHTHSWNLNVQQGLGSASVLQVAYVGSHGRNTSPTGNPNRIDPVSGTRPFPGFGNMDTFANCCTTNYHGLQTTLRGRAFQRLAFNVNHTWSHAHDHGGVSFSSSSPQDVVNWASEYASADYDVRHVMQFDFVLDIPAIPAVPAWLGGGWQLNSISAMRSGLNVNIVCGCDSAGVGSPQGRPDVVPGQPIHVAGAQAPSEAIFNSAAFVQPAPGTFGNARRNLGRGRPVYNFDVSLFKNFRVREGHQVQFRTEVFNLFNTPQFSTPSGNITSANFGVILSTIPAAGGFGSNRQMQFAVRYQF